MSFQPVRFQQACSQLVESKYSEIDEEEISQEICSSPLIDHTYNEPQFIGKMILFNLLLVKHKTIFEFIKKISDNNAQFRPESVGSLSSCSSNSSSFLPTPTKSIALISSKVKPIPKKIVPPMDDFAKKKKIKGAHLEEELVKAGTTISDAMSTVSTLIGSTINKEKDGYMLAIEEGLKHVPEKSRTKCIIEVLQVIQKYEVRE